MAEALAEVLLVEDSPDDAAFFVRAFEQTGLAARLRVLPDGAEALAFVFGTGRFAALQPAANPRLIVLDLKLPKVNGLEVLRRLKADPRTRRIPVVIWSSSQEARDLAESCAMGVNSYVVKPMAFDEFGRSVQMLCQYWLQFNQAPEQ
jgi:two-component system response regulator